MNNKIIADQYLKHLENADMEKVVALFADDGKVISPIYGTKLAGSFMMNSVMIRQILLCILKVFLNKKTRMNLPCILPMNGRWLMAKK